MTLENIRRVAQYWTSGDGEKARALPAPLFNQILGVVIADEGAKHTRRASRFFTGTEAYATIRFANNRRRGEAKRLRCAKSRGRR